MLGQVCLPQIQTTTADREDESSRGRAMQRWQRAVAAAIAAKVRSISFSDCTYLATGNATGMMLLLPSPGGYVIVVVTGSIARSANLPVFRLLRGRF